MSNRSFIVCGPQSSGNRLVAGILIRAGLAGSSSTEQPKVGTADFSKPMVVINHWIEVRDWIHHFLKHGYEPVMLIPVRECHALVRSMERRGHDPDPVHAKRHAAAVVSANLADAMAFDVDVEIIPYESLSLPGMVRCFLTRYDLRVDNLNEPLDLRGQQSDAQPVNYNDYDQTLL